MSDDIDLDRYFARIGYGGGAAPTLETLTAIQARQVDAMPFENLDPLLGRPVKLGADSLQAKLVGERRGGYCFELNGLLKRVLDALGYRTTGLAGRVRWMSPPDAPLGPRSHMTIRVDLPDGPYLVDAGFGAQLLDQPLRLAPGEEQATTHATWRIDDDDGLYSLRVRIPDGWRTAYVFTGEPQVQADYEMASWFTSTLPTSLFVNSLMAERLTADARHNLIGTRLVSCPRGGTPSERALSSADSLAETLETVFGIACPGPADAVFAKVKPAA